MTGGGRSPHIPMEGLMHSIIVDAALADDFRLTDGATELWTADEHFLGAFVPAPGGPPGPEWADDGLTWCRLIVAAPAADKLGAAVGEVKVRDPAGRMLGWFVPVGRGEERHFLAELDAGTALEDALADLKGHAAW